MPPVTRSRAAAPPKTTKTTTTTTTTTSKTSSAAQRSKDPLPKPTARLAKKVAFKDASEDEKENDPPVTKSRGRPAAKKPPPKPVLKPTVVKSALKPSPPDTSKPTGIRAKPIRNPVSTTTTKTTKKAIKATDVSAKSQPASRAPLLDATRVLSPKKITQVAKATPRRNADGSDTEDELATKPTPSKPTKAADSEDELNGGKTPIRNLSMSPKRPLSPIKMLSPAKLPSPARQTLHPSPPRLASLEKASILLEKSPQRLPPRLLSPQREHQGLHPTLGGPSPKRTPNINFDQSILDPRSPLKLSPPITLPDPFVEVKQVTEMPVIAIVASPPMEAPATPQDRASTDIEDPVEEHITPIFDEFINPSPLSEKPLSYLDGVVCFLDIRTAEGADANGFFTKLLTTWGAKISPHFRIPDPTTTPGTADFQNITHVIWKDGSPKTLEKVQTAYRHDHKIHCVGVNWITDCEKHSERMPEASYTIDIKQRLAEGGSRRRRTMEPGFITPAGHGSVKKSHRAKRATLHNSDALRILANTPLRHPNKYPGILDHPDLPPLPKELETPHIFAQHGELDTPHFMAQDAENDFATINATPRNSLPMAMSPIQPYEHYNPATAYTPVAHTPLHKLLQKTAPAKRTFRGLFTDLDDKYAAQTPASVKKARRNSDV